jgi:uncharacterized protein
VKIDLSKVTEEPLRFNEKLQVDSDRLDVELVSAPVQVRLAGEVWPHGDSFTVAGRCEMEAELSCSRCLDPVVWAKAEDFSVEYRHPTSIPMDDEIGLEGDDLDVSFLDGEELDLVALAAEQVMLALPMRIVCDENCAGLCPRCGANRNEEGACSCEPETDPRWQALADIAGTSSKS